MCSANSHPTFRAGSLRGWAVRSRIPRRKKEHTMKKRKTKRKLSAALVNYALEARLAMMGRKVQSMMQLAREERERGREEVAEGIVCAVDALRAQLLCERMGWPVEVSRQLAQNGLSQPLPSDRLICLYSGGHCSGCGYSEDVQAGRTYVVRDVNVYDGEAWSVRLVGILGSLDENGMESAWYPERFIVLEDVKAAFAAVRAAGSRRAG